MTLLAWLTQCFHARSWVGGKRSPGDGGQIGPPHEHPQRLGAVDRLHHHVFGEKRSVTGYSSSLQSSLWSGSVSSPCTRPPAASPPETTPSVSPFDPNRWCWDFGQVVKLRVGTQSSCSADSFSTRPGVFLDLGLFRVSTPLGGPPPPVHGVEVKCPLIPAGDSFYSRGVAQRLKPPRNFFWILQKVVIIITCC